MTTMEQIVERVAREHARRTKQLWDGPGEPSSERCINEIRLVALSLLTALSEAGCTPEQIEAWERATPPDGQIDHEEAWGESDLRALLAPRIAELKYLATDEAREALAKLDGGR